MARQALVARLLREVFIYRDRLLNERRSHLFISAG
jgi:hypothetical protein